MQVFLSPLGTSIHQFTLAFTAVSLRHVSHTYKTHLRTNLSALWPDYLLPQGRVGCVRKRVEGLEQEYGLITRTSWLNEDVGGKQNLHNGSYECVGVSGRHLEHSNTLPPTIDSVVARR